MNNNLSQTETACFGGSDPEKAQTVMKMSSVIKVGCKKYI